MALQRARGTDRILDILSYFETNTEAVSRNALAGVLGCPRSTVYMLVDQLIEKGWLFQTATGGLRLGYRAGLLGLTYASQEPFERVAREVIQRLAAETGEVAEVNVIENWRQLVLISASGRGLTYLRIVEGCRYPLPLTSSARVQLSTVSPQVLRERIPESDFRTSAGTEIPFDQFVAEIDEASRLGYGVVKGLIDPFFGAISVPVHNSAGRPIAAASIVMPLPQLELRLASLVTMLRGAAVELEHLVRVKGWPLGEAMLRTVED